jgi:hypothetical protein
MGVVERTIHGMGTPASSNLLATEDARFVATHPRSQELFARAQRSLLWVRSIMA